MARLRRYESSDESEDLDKSNFHSTEVILLPFDTPTQLSSYIIEALYLLATTLLVRSERLEQPGDMVHAIKCLRYLQDQSLETITVARSDIIASLVRALAGQVELGSVDPTRNIREMATLYHELFTSGIEESLLIDTVKSSVSAIGMTLTYGQLPPDEVIECLREARIRFPNLDQVRLALAYSLHLRFDLAPIYDDCNYEEAMSILDEVPSDPNRTVKPATHLAGSLAWARLALDSTKPENLTEAIFRFRTCLNATPSEDPDRRFIMGQLADLEEILFKQFGVKSGRQEDNAKIVHDSHVAASPQMAELNCVVFPLPMPEKTDIRPHMEALVSVVNITGLTNIETAIEYCRLCVTSPHSDVPLTLLVLGRLLYRLFHLTGNIDHLHETIAVHRDVIKMPGIQIDFHTILAPLILALVSRFELFKDRRDIEEAVELCTVVATDTSIEARRRFPTSCIWAQAARYSRHPSTLTAYETAISLMQESLSFAPTLETQHLRLLAMRDEYEKLPTDYMSYLVQIGQLEQAIETLERGRGLLWSEMRGLHTSIDQLHAVNSPLAEKFAAVNRDLEALTTLSSPVVWTHDGQVGGREGMDQLGRLVARQRKLVEERDRLLSWIRTQPGFNSFLIPPSFDTLRVAAAGGPVILINHSHQRSDIIILLHDSPPSLILTSDDFYDGAKGLHDTLLTARNKCLDSKEYEDALGYVLEHLYDLVGQPVIQRLHELNIPKQSRVWWCPTSVFCSLPLHAMGPIRSDGPTKLYFSDLYIPSYTPSLSALIESRKSSTQPLNTPSVLLVVQPDAQMPSSLQEMRVVRTVCPSVEILFREKATPLSTLEHLKHYRFAHISSYRVLEIGKPFDAFFKLYEGSRLTLLDIVRSRLPTAEFAFLSACHTAEITEESIENEGLHLAAAVQYSGFRSVVGTMWAMADIDGPVIAESFYQLVFSDRWKEAPYYERTAEALRDAVRNLRRKKKMPLERWVNYVHYGA